MYEFSQKGEYIHILLVKSVMHLSLLDIKLKPLSTFPISWNNSDRKPLYSLQTVNNNYMVFDLT